MLNYRLTKKELNRLGAFLATGEDQAWMGLTELHGFLCALISGPNLIVPSKWHSYAFGDDGLIFDSEEEAQTLLMLLSRLHNYILAQLNGEMPCVPLLYKEKRLLIYTEVDAQEELARWCRAYIEGTRFDGTWNNEEMAVFLLLPFAVLSNEYSLIGKEDAEGNIIEDDSVQRQLFKEGLSKNIVTIYDFWLSKRNSADESNIVDLRSSNKNVGRNEPCPCGSGKKYKKCCLNSDEIAYH